MGNFFHIINPIPAGYNYFIETGTGSGNTLDLVCIRTSVEHIYSIECEQKVFALMQKKYACNNRINLNFGYSHEVLPSILPHIKGKAIWWLDAHFPGAAIIHGDCAIEPDPIKNLPLIEELRCLYNNRDTSHDIIVCDDLRVYEDGTYTGGPLPDNVPTSKQNLLKHIEKWQTTHTITRSYNEQGYLVMIPKYINIKTN